LKEEALDRTVWRTHFGKDYGPVVRQTTEWMNEWKVTCIRCHILSVVIMWLPLFHSVSSYQ
jgi:hypothetical protein